MVSVTCALVRVKREVGQWADAAIVGQLCEQVGHRFRRGTLDPVTTIQLFMLQVLDGNTAINHLRHLTDLMFWASAYCQAPMRLPVVLLERLARSIGDRLIEAGAGVGRWRGHRVWHVDGTGFSMPDEPAFFVLLALWITTWIGLANLEEKSIALIINNISKEKYNEVYIFDTKDFRFLSVSAAVKQKSGYSATEISQLTPMDIEPEFSLEKFK